MKSLAWHDGRLEGLHQSILDRLQEGVIVVDDDGQIVVANSAAAHLVGVESGDLAGRELGRLGEVCGLGTSDGAAMDWDHCPGSRALAGEEVAGETFRLSRGDGSVAWVESSASPLVDARDQVGRGAVITFTDVTQRMERERRIRHEADHDHLTGLANRRMLARTLDSTIARASGSARGVALLLVDLDGFKAINDRLGHQAGDAVLREVAARLEQNLRERDLVARYGGDEFVLLLPDLTRPEEVASAFAERVAEVLAEPIHVNGAPLCLSASIGVAVHPRDGADATALLDHADRSMYTHKVVGALRLSP